MSSEARCPVCLHSLLFVFNIFTTELKGRLTPLMIPRHVREEREAGRQLSPMLPGRPPSFPGVQGCLLRADKKCPERKGLHLGNE